MNIFPLLAVNPVMKVIAVIFILLAVVLILVILIQKGRGGGLSGAFGGGMASGILGTKTGDFLTWVTVAVVGLFLTLAVIMAKYYTPYETEPAQRTVAPIEQQQQSPEPPLAPGGVDDVNADVNSMGS